MVKKKLYTCRYLKTCQVNKMKFSYISNNCLSQVIYFSESREYDSPFIGSLFVNDFDFLKLCKNYNYYISIKPEFSKPKNDSKWCIQNTGPWYKHNEIQIPYPVMFLEDIEIHWIHEKDINVLLEKYHRHIGRFQAENTVPLFMLSISDLCNDHDDCDYAKLIKEFTDIPNSIYLTKHINDLKINKNIFLIKDWLKTDNTRNSSHIYNFHDGCNRERYIKDIINFKTQNIDEKYSIVIPIKINELNSFEIFRDICLYLYNKFLETEYLDTFYIICPEDNINAISKHTKKYHHIPFQFIKEESILHDNMKVISGWHKQQIIKLAVSKYIKTQYYLIIDSDLYLNQPFSYRDMFNDNKIKYSHEPWQTINNKYYSTNSNWWIASCNILNFPIENLHNDNHLMGVTPQTMITNEVISLIDHIKNIYGDDWQHKLCEMKFTEYTLYWLYLIKNEKTNLYTIQGKQLWQHDLDRNILYYQTEQEQYNIVRNSLVIAKTYFSVVQSYLPVNMSIIKDVVYTINKIEYDAIFLVSSTVTPTQLKFFNVQDRFAQTLETIKSIKKYFPNSFCVLIEGSILSTEHKECFDTNFDYILDCSNDNNVIPYVRNIRNIGHGEQKLLEKGIEFLEKNILPYSISKYVFKLGARYILSETFKIENYHQDKYNFYEEFDADGNSLNVYTTGLYSIPSNKLSDFKQILINVHNHLSIDTEMIEQYFYNHIPKEEVHTLKVLGLEGRLNYNGHFFSK